MRMSKGNNKGQLQLGKFRKFSVSPQYKEGSPNPSSLCLNDIYTLFDLIIEFKVYLYKM